MTFVLIQHIPCNVDREKPGFFNRISLEARTVKKPGFWGVLHNHLEKLVWWWVVRPDLGAAIALEAPQELKNIISQYLMQN